MLGGINMLKEKYESGEIYTIKLKSGEEIIAKLVAVTEAGFSIDQPLRVVPGPEGYGFMPWIYSSTTHKFDIASAALVTSPILTEAEAAKHYVQSTTSIQLL